MTATFTNRRGGQRLDLRDRGEVELVRALLARHARKSMEPGLSGASAVVARRLLRRLDT